MLTVVTGPPCAGKSTYIAQRAAHGDIVIDLDRIALAITTDDTTHHDYGRHIRNVALAARRAAITAALRVPGAHTWIIDTDPSGQARRTYAMHRARIVELDPGIAVCMERANRLRPAWVRPLIAAWYRRSTTTG